MSIPLPVVNCRHADGETCRAGHYAPCNVAVADGLCPHFEAADAAKPRVIWPPAPTRYDGSHEWAEATRLAIAGDVVAFDAWVVSVTDWLPDCCKPHWIDYLAAHPLEGDRFVWLNDAHNAVNVRLAKPTWTLEQARAKRR